MSICTGCCTTLDHIVTYVFKQLLLKGKYLKQIIEIIIKACNKCK